MIGAAGVLTIHFTAVADVEVIVVHLVEELLIFIHFNGLAKLIT